MKYVKNVVVLTVITVVAGFLLGYVYDITKGPIQEANDRALQEALKAVFAESESFDEISSDNSGDILAGAGFTAEKINLAYAAKDSSGSLLGYVFSITTSSGYGGDINIILGIKSDGAINGVEILSISETPGLGMKADTPEFKSQFKGKNVAQISFTKSGAKEEYEIDALSGATITTTAMTNAVNAGLSYFNAININGGENNE